MAYEIEIPNLNDEFYRLVQLMLRDSAAGKCPDVKMDGEDFILVVQEEDDAVEYKLTLM